MKCPNCKKEIDRKSLALTYIPSGREAVCPECGKKILFSKVISKPVRGRPKHMSKKDRLRERRAQ